jgi:hypothetical protein
VSARSSTGWAESYTRPAGTGQASRAQRTAAAAYRGHHLPTGAAKGRSARARENCARSRRHDVVHARGPVLCARNALKDVSRGVASDRLVQRAKRCISPSEMPAESRTTATGFPPVGLDAGHVHLREPLPGHAHQRRKQTDCTA